MNGHWKRHDKAKVIIEAGWGKGRGIGGVWLCHDKICLISPLRLFIILIIPPHWQSISYSSPL